MSEFDAFYTTLHDSDLNRMQGSPYSSLEWHLERSQVEHAKRRQIYSIVSTKGVNASPSNGQQSESARQLTLPGRITSLSNYFLDDTFVDDYNTFQSLRRPDSDSKESDVSSFDPAIEDSVKANIATDFSWQQGFEDDTAIDHTTIDPFQKLFQQQTLQERIERETPILNEDSASLGGRNARLATKKLDYDRYTVGWICALPEEMTAAKAMLDEVHQPLPNPFGDHNAYQLGSIGRHNVVITCIRSGVYGTTSATAAAIAMCSTYPNSKLAPLIVGIGGGVPRPETDDIHLGDVVISTPTSNYPAVVQYDYGKALQDDTLDVKGSLNKPAPALLSALSHFRSELSPRPGRVSKHISTALRQFSLGKQGFSRPSRTTDILFAPECEHLQKGGTSCPRCPARSIDRKPRSHTDPEIYYGGIASGNQVIKHARKRDRIASQFGVLCIEIEAAGVMDYLPCLVIRGICDYCDSHKNKKWQKFAALAAAAVAKELLSCIPFSVLGTNEETGYDLGRREQLLRLLDFEDSDTRLATIKQAHSRTCKWVFQQKELLDWLDPEKYQHHHGLLWMKGKPGAGKSTIMRYLYEHTERLCDDSQAVAIVSFFFNARGVELGRSTLGMYRSITSQILERIPTLQSLLDNIRPRNTSVESFVWTLEALKDILREIVKYLNRTYLICYIDALDECPEDQVRDMVDFFEQLMELATYNHLHICFSSRHYPNISTKIGYEFVLENQQGHMEDTLNYLGAELVLGNNRLTSKLKEKVYLKSGRIFLWVVLVVRILRREYDRGGVHKLMSILNEIPVQVDELFRDILTRDSVDLPQLVTSIRWVLYAQRPLRLDELYYAVLCSESFLELEPRCDDELGRGDMHRYMLSCSKGIMETTTMENPAVQFIHETVREFLLQPAVLRGLWPGFEGIFEGPSHETLKQYCHGYIKQVESKGLLSAVNESTTLRQQFTHDYPFIVYAVQHVLDHADCAEQSKISQADFLRDFEHVNWIACYNFLIASHSFEPSENFGYILTITNRPSLFQCWLQETKDSVGLSDVDSYLLLRLLRDNNFSAFEKAIMIGRTSGSKLTSLSSDIRTAFNMLQRILPLDLLSSKPRIELITKILRTEGCNILQELNEAFLCAAFSGVPEAVQMFLRLGAISDARNASGRSAIHESIVGAQLRSTQDAWISAVRCIEVLLDQGVNVDLVDNQGKTPLHIAAGIGTESVVRLLLRRGASIDAHDLENETPLAKAIQSENHRVTEVLLEMGARVVIEHFKSCLRWSVLPTQKEAAQRILSRCPTGITADMISALKDCYSQEKISLMTHLFQAYSTFQQQNSDL